MLTEPHTKIVVAGASGFVGRELVRALRDDYSVIALSRKAHLPQGGIEHRACDLFSLLDAEKGVAGADAAFYLVHSMMPSARLTQGGFADFDLIAADNFARACKKAGVKHIVYLGGLIPDHRPLSEHLQSRLEVEQTLASHGIPVTTLRAGIVIGAGGSSFLMMKRLIERLPALACPEWTRSRTQPIALGDVVRLLKFCVLNPAAFDRSYDVGTEEVVTYRELLERMAGALKLKRRFINVPVLSPSLSKLWVEAITGAPDALVAPLVESLKSSMVCRDRHLQAMEGGPVTPIDEALREALDAKLPATEKPIAYQRRRAERLVSDVRSVQRLPLPPERNAEWVAREYMRALPELMFSLVRTEVSHERICSFYVIATNWLLLQLTYSPARSAPDRQLFYITGGLLALNQGRGRLEFRSLRHPHVMLSAIHEFRPRLPWRLYEQTQARAHLWVMQKFSRHLTRLSQIPARYVEQI